ncbi:hypothetical protein T10_5200, partial [Trichinella papuae]
LKPNLPTSLLLLDTDGSLLTVLVSLNTLGEELKKFPPFMPEKPGDIKSEII